MHPWPYDHPEFLEPHHQHDLTAIEHLAQPPYDLLPFLSRDICSLIIQVQDATSIVYASWQRLDELFDERFEHIFLQHPPGNVSRGGDKIEYSEPSFFHYRNRIEAERSYLLFEAVPDWQSKLARLEHSLLYDPVIRSLLSSNTLSNISGIDTSSNDPLDPLHQWFSRLKSEITGLRSRAERTHVPDFDRTVRDFEAHYLKCLGMELTDKQADATIREVADLGRRDSGIGLDDNLADTPKEKIPEMDIDPLQGQRMDERRDSGIEMEVGCDGDAEP